MSNTCVCCGWEVPECRHACRQCEGKPNFAEIARMCERIRDIVLESYNSERPIQHVEAIEVHDLLKKIEKEVQK